MDIGALVEAKEEDSGAVTLASLIISGGLAAEVGLVFSSVTTAGAEPFQGVGSYFGAIITMAGAIAAFAWVPLMILASLCVSAAREHVAAILRKGAVFLCLSVPATLVWSIFRFCSEAASEHIEIESGLKPAWWSDPLVESATAGEVLSGLIVVSLVVAIIAGSVKRQALE